MLNPALPRKLDRLDAEGLEMLHHELVGRREAAHVRFGKSRSAKDGDSYRRRSGKLGEVRSRLRRIEDRGE